MPHQSDQPAPPAPTSNTDLFGQPETPETNPSASSNASDARDAALVAAYIEACRDGKTLDDLPYTDEFERVVARVEPFFAKAPALETPRERRHEILRLLQNMRKASRLPTRKAVAEMAATRTIEDANRAASAATARVTSPPARVSSSPTGVHPSPTLVTEQEESLVRDLIAKHTGMEGKSGVGRRDRLPYSPEFDALRDDFVRTSGRDISDHDLWRLIAKLAK